MKMDPKTRLEDDTKRKLHPALQKVLETDVILTKKFISFLLNFFAVQSFTRHCKFLEVSCHGIVWIAGWLAWSWFIDSKNLYQMQINMLIGLFLDIVFVAVLKSITRRRRPSEDPFSIGPDKFSFPSGHASRSIFILGYFTILYPLTVFVWPPIFAWAISVCVSRLLLYRHHILDVAAGVFLGLFNTLLMWIIWLDSDTSESLMMWISDDRVDRAE